MHSSAFAVGFIWVFNNVNLQRQLEENKKKVLFIVIFMNTCTKTYSKFGRNS